MPRLLFTIEYLGTNLSGWQRQGNAPSVQQHCEEALALLFKAAVTLEGSGRTDSGVHALAQQAHADVPFLIPESGLLKGINDLLPEDIRVKEVREVSGEFHCRFHAKTKTYLYQIWNGPTWSAFHKATHAFVRQSLDVNAMKEGASFLVGNHDFKSYTVTEPEVRSTRRTISAIEISDPHPRIEIRVTADGFLRYMVRRIVGMLIQIGTGNLDPEAARSALEPKFTEARWTAPAHGLVLEKVLYPSEEEGPQQKP